MRKQRRPWNEHLLYVSVNTVELYPHLRIGFICYVMGVLAFVSADFAVRHHYNSTAYIYVVTEHDVFDFQRSSTNLELPWLRIACLTHASLGL